MNIGEAARQAGINAKRVRHYETIGLLPKAARSGSNYRSYSENDVHMLRFIRQARDLGFAIADIRALLGLWRDRRRPSREVKKLVQRHTTELRARIAELQAMLGALEHLAHHCHGDERPECPILDGLAESSGTASGSMRPTRSKG